MRGPAQWLIAAVLSLAITSCTVNPVTGDKELNLIGEQQELAIGEKNYGPYRQAQGGDYTADPELVAYVQEVGERIAAVSDRPLPYEFQVVNDDSPNAWALPGGKIAINRGLLLELESEAELAAVLGHEVIHAAARHSAQSLQRDLFLQGALVVAGVALADSDYAELGMLGAGVGANLTKSHYSRDAEREADLYGMRYMVRAGYDPAAAVGLQKTFVRLAEEKRQDWLSGLFASHPPSQERVDNNTRELAVLNNPGGETGRERYQRKIARLKRTKPAYEAYAEARKALKAGELEKAEALVEKAIRIEPKEAQFLLARAEIRERQGKSKNAQADLDRAVALNPGYFLPRLERGLFLMEQGGAAAARRDLEASIAQLPTAEGYFGLGQLEQKAGNRALAVAHFRKVAESGSSVGTLAAKRLARLDLADNPNRYIEVTLLLDANSRLLMRLRNKAAVPVTGLQIAIGRQVGLGFAPARIITVQGVLQPEEAQVLDPRVGTLNAAEARGLTARVQQARLAGAK